MRKIMKAGRTTIAVVLLLVIVANISLLAWNVRSVKAAPLDTYHSSWHLVRETADENGDTKAAVYNLTTAGNFANKNSSSVLAGGPFRILSVKAGIGANEGYSAGGVWMFAICGKNYNVGGDNTIDNTFSFNIVGWSKINGMLQTIAEGDGVLGTQAVILYPDDGADAVGALVSMTAVTYTHGTKVFTKTNVGLNVVTGMMVYVTGTNLTNGYYAITNVADNNTITMSGMSSSNNNTDSTVQINPAFWADTITLDETTKWPSVGIYNSGDNEVCIILIDMTGLEWVQFIFYDALPAQTLEAGDITVYGRRY